MITLNRRQIVNAKMLQQTSLLEISYRSDSALGRALSPIGPIYRPLYSKVTMEEYVRRYVTQLNRIANLDELIVHAANAYDSLWLLSYYGDHEPEDPTNIIISYLVYAYPKQFLDGRGYSTESDRTLMHILGRGPEQ
jgi:hypothetical protein